MFNMENALRIVFIIFAFILWIFSIWDITKRNKNFLSSNLIWLTIVIIPIIGPILYFTITKSMIFKK